MKQETMLKIVLGSALLWESATHLQNAELHVIEETFVSEALGYYEVSPPSGVQQWRNNQRWLIFSLTWEERVEGTLVLAKV